MSTLISWKIRQLLYLMAISLILAIVPTSGLVQPLRAAGSESGVPLLFVENVDQFPAVGNGETVQFVVQGEESTLRLTDQALWFTHVTPPEAATAEVQALDDESRTGLNLRLAFVDANPQPRIEPFNRLETRVSYFRGSDPAGWQIDVPVWGGVRYVDLYPGLDLELTGENGRLALRWVVKPEAGVQSSDRSSLEGVRFQVEGAESLALDGADQLRLTTALGEMTLPLPYPVDAAGAPLDSSTQPAVDGLEIVAPVGQQPPPASDLVSVAAAGDLLFSTYLAGSGGEGINGLAVDGTGSTYITGL
jgi:hypothetical protein